MVRAFADFYTPMVRFSIRKTGAPARLLERYVDLIAASAIRMVKTIEAAGFDAEVVTCPTWDGRALIAHQAMVHRGGYNLRGEDPPAVPNQTEIRERSRISGRTSRGTRRSRRRFETRRRRRGTRVSQRRAATKQFWARRQAHETTIHMVDALSASWALFRARPRQRSIPTSPSTGSTSCCAASSHAAAPRSSMAPSTTSTWCQPTRTGGGRCAPPSG